MVMTNTKTNKTHKGVFLTDMDRGDNLDQNSSFYGVGFGNHFT
jgi:hypothetical protein